MIKEKLESRIKNTEEFIEKDPYKFNSQQKVTYLYKDTDKALSEGKITPEQYKAIKDKLDKLQKQYYISYKDRRVDSTTNLK